MKTMIAITINVVVIDRKVEGIEAMVFVVKTALTSVSTKTIVYLQKSVTSIQSAAQDIAFGILIVINRTLAKITSVLLMTTHRSGRLLLLYLYLWR